MLLTVIVPDKQPGMERMLQRELAGIEAEVIKQSWTKGLEKARGKFICLLERNSAISPGTIKRNLNEFITNPKYRKLAMVSSRVDMDVPMLPVSWTFVRIHDGKEGALAAMNPASNAFHTVRIGYGQGAIIRRSSLIRSGIPLRLHPRAFAIALSLYFWENGLRVAMEPESIYYAPEKVTYKRWIKPKTIPQPSDEVWGMWEREWIS